MWWSWHHMRTLHTSGIQDTQFRCLCVEVLALSEETCQCLRQQGRQEEAESRNASVDGGINNWDVGSLRTPLRLWEELRRVWVRYLAGAAKQLVVDREKMASRPKRWLRVVITQPP